MLPPDEIRTRKTPGITRDCSKFATPKSTSRKLDALFCSCHIAKWMLFWVCFSVMVAPAIAPVRDSAPNRDDQYHVLAGVTEWTGVPRRDFRRIWFASLIVALGAIFQDGWTLLQTARDQDAGGPGNPAAGANAATTTRQSENRNHRLFMSILKYIDKTSSVYKLATESFNHDGRGLFNFLWVYGHKPYTTKQNQKRELVWKDATVATLCIAIDEDTPQVWKEWCVEHGQRLNKTLSDIRIKYLEGFPDSFDVVVMPERASLANAGEGNYVHPAMYPAHYPAHLAGTAHPFAALPDIDTLAQYLSSVWVDMIINGKIKAPPKGSVLETQEITDDKYKTNDYIRSTSSKTLENSALNLATQGPGFESRSDPPLFGAFQIAPVFDPTNATIRNQVFAVNRATIGPQTLCYVCGGRGHVSRIDGLTCPTLELGVQIPRPLLESTIYSDGIKFPKFTPKSRADPGATSRNRNRAVVKVVSPNPTSGYDSSASTRSTKARVKEVKKESSESSDSEESHGAHQVEIAMDFGDIKI